MPRVNGVEDGQNGSSGGQNWEKRDFNAQRYIIMGLNKAVI